AHARRRLFDARRREHAAAVAPRLLRHSDAEAGGAADEIRRALVHAARLFRSVDVGRARNAQVTLHTSFRGQCTSSEEPASFAMKQVTRSAQDGRTVALASLVKHWCPAGRGRRSILPACPSSQPNRTLSARSANGAPITGSRRISQ